MPSSLEMMLLREMIKGNSSIFEQIREIIKKEEEEKKKAAKPKPTTFSPGQVFLIILGLGPAMGMGALIGYAHLGQYLLDAIRQLH